MRIPPTLKSQRDFKTLSREGQKWVTPSFIVQAQHKEKQSTSPPSVGYTVSKKVGKAVTRNKIKRRLREVFRIFFLKGELQNCNYVVIARKGCEKTSFEAILKELTWALKHAHRLLSECR